MNFRDPTCPLRFCSKAGGTPRVQLYKQQRLILLYNVHLEGGGCCVCGADRRGRETATFLGASDWTFIFHTNRDKSVRMWVSEAYQKFDGLNYLNVSLCLCLLKKQNHVFFEDYNL